MSVSSLAESKTKRLNLSPLRYPGGKAALYPTLRSFLHLNSMRGGTYVEPYAGGAGAAAALLVTGQVSRIVINDLDPAIFAFWTAVTNYSDEFIAAIRAVPLNVEEWSRQKLIYAHKNESDPFSLGFATFYLNRTNRSGVLNAGPIGGMNQLGNYKIDARFNRPALEERLRLLGLHAAAIEVRNEDGVQVVEDYGSRPNTLIYADPPYFEKAGSLYLNAFTDRDHRTLAKCLNQRSQASWLLTYDNFPLVHELYADRRRREIGLNYSARHVHRATEIMVLSDSLTAPD